MQRILFCELLILWIHFDGYIDGKNLHIRYFFIYIYVRYHDKVTDTISPNKMYTD